MRRIAMNELKSWKDKTRRKPLLLRGARQTGKTWLLKEFGRTEFDSVAYVDLLASSRAREIFDEDFDIQRIISALSAETATKVVAGKTLIVLDEVQEAPRALTALKYFAQDAPAYHVAAAGSYLGIAKHEGTSFPVGKVNTVSVEPMNFLEYLDALGEEVISEALHEQGAAGIDSALFPKMEQLLKEYLFVGGMPEAIATFTSERDYHSAREVQNEILDAYDLDFSKHAPARILERMRLVWEGLPSQLSKENKKFVYGSVRPGARARDFEESIQWLADYGAVRRISRATALRVPLPAYRDEGAFKLFCVDVGLLGALSHLQPSVVLEGSRLFTEFKGALTEQYVCQQLASRDISAMYWSSDTGRAEIDFAVELGGEPVPIEVKAAENLQSKSLKVARNRFDLKRCMRTSLSGRRDEGWLVNVPLWAIASEQEG
ncbi:MAG: ATP-binding protein [Atopobiaceae bacterium]|nr:ATP-binding protein [Atopobiaceae bacterium]